MLDDTVEVQAAPRLRSKVTAVKKQKGRGFKGDMDIDEPPERHGGRYDALEAGSGPGPQKCEQLLLHALGARHDIRTHLMSQFLAASSQQDGPANSTHSISPLDCRSCLSIWFYTCRQLESCFHMV